MTETPLPKEIHDFEISTEKNKYKIEMFSSESKLCFKASSLNSIKTEIYQNFYSFNQIQGNKYFKMCENIEEVSLVLLDLLKSNKIKIIEETNEIKLLISINFPLVKEIIFNLKQKEKNIEEKVNELYKIIEIQQKEINNLKNEVKELKQINENRDKRKKEKEKEKEKEKLIYLQNNSTIIKNDPEKEKAIRNWINPNIKNLEFKLLFKMSKDGYNCSDFHRCCDNKGETLLLFETDKNYKFGAYTPLNWVTSESGEVDDPNDNKTFLFSLNQMKKFTKIQGKNPKTAKSKKDKGPLFGGGTDLGINKDMRTGWSNSETFLTNRELTNGERDFNVKEIEIFKIINNN